MIRAPLFPFGFYIMKHVVCLALYIKLVQVVLAQDGIRCTDISGLAKFVKSNQVCEINLSYLYICLHVNASMHENNHVLTIRSMTITAIVWMDQMKH